MKGADLDELSKDEFFKAFVVSNVDVTKFVSDTVKADAVDMSLQKLARGFTVVNSSIKREISQHERALLDQSSHILMLEDALRTASAGVARIEASCDSVAASIRAPLDTLRKGTTELERLQTACEVLRRVLRFVGCVRRIEKHMENAQLAPAARALVDLQALEGPEGGIEGVDCVKELLPRVEELKRNVRDKAAQLLADGLKVQSHTDVGAALLTFSVLGALRERTRAVVSLFTNRARRAVDAGIGAAGGAEEDNSGSKPGAKTNGSSGGNSANAATDQWAVLETTLNELHELCLSVWHLQLSLVTVKDGTSPLWDALALDHASLTEPFWAQLSAKLSGAIALPARRALHRDYPRLYRTLRDFAHRCMASYEMMQLEKPHRIEEEAALATLLHPLAGLMTAHVSRCKRRLKKAADAMFGAVSHPTTTSAAATAAAATGGVGGGSSRAAEESKTTLLCRAMTRELADARDVPPVLEAVVTEITTTCQFVATECLKRVERNPAALNVVTQTAVHLGNASIHNSMVSLESTLRCCLRDDLETACLHLVNAQDTIAQLLVEVLRKMDDAHAATFRGTVLTLYVPTVLLASKVNPRAPE